jgi:hypothetical protein
VHELLCGDRRRQLIAQRHKSRKEQVVCQIKRYTRKYKKKPPTDVVERFVHDVVQRSSFVPTSHITDITPVVQKISLTWNKFSTTPYAQQNKQIIHIRDFVLGCLYLQMRGGIEPFVPASPSLAGALPALVDLRLLNFDVKHVTYGRNHLLAAFKPTTQKLLSTRPPSSDDPPSPKTRSAVSSSERAGSRRTDAGVRRTLSSSGDKALLI